MELTLHPTGQQFYLWEAFYRGTNALLLQLRLRLHKFYPMCYQDLAWLVT